MPHARKHFSLPREDQTANQPQPSIKMARMTVAESVPRLGMTLCVGVGCISLSSFLCNQLTTHSLL